jgi:glycerophosphoryl diester phosphodiesterase
MERIKYKHLIQQDKISEGSFCIIGHRGCGGLMPENTIGGFIAAVKSGARVLHLNIACTADNKIVVATQPYISSEKFLNVDGSPVTEAKNICDLTFEQLRSYDCGLKFNNDFPYRKLIPSSVPLLEEVITRVEKFTLWNNLKPVSYCIEFSTSHEKDDLLYPRTEPFVLSVFDIVRLKGISRRCTILSADERPLKLINYLDEKITIALIPDSDSTDNMNSDLDFHIYSPDYRKVNSILINEVHNAGMLIIPSVVNDILDMNEMLQLGADGIITDYPDIALKLIN